MGSKRSSLGGIGLLWLKLYNELAVEVKGNKVIEGASDRMQLILRTDNFDIMRPVLHLRHTELREIRMAIDVEFTSNGVVY